MEEDPIAYSAEADPAEDLPVASCLDLEITISECMTNLKTRVETAIHCGRSKIEIDMNQAPQQGQQANVMRRYAMIFPRHRMEYNLFDRILVVSW